MQIIRSRGWVPPIKEAAWSNPKGFKNEIANTCQFVVMSIKPLTLTGAHANTETHETQFVQIVAAPPGRFTRALEEGMPPKSGVSAKTRQKTSELFENRVHLMESNETMP